MEWLTKEWDSQFMGYDASQCIWVSRKFITPELIINQRKDIILLLINPTRSTYLPITRITSIRYRGWTQLKWPSHKVWVQLIQWELSVDKSKVLKWNLGCGHGWNKTGKIIEPFPWIFPWNMSYIFPWKPRENSSSTYVDFPMVFWSRGAGCNRIQHPQWLR